MMPISRGKQLPSAPINKVKQPQQSNNDATASSDSDNQHQGSTAITNINVLNKGGKSTASRPSWRMLDVAATFEQQRVKKYAQVTQLISPGTAPATKTLAADTNAKDGNNNNASNSNEMPLSCQFNTDRALKSLQKRKMQIVQQAFRIAATVVLEAVPFENDTIDDDTSDKTTEINNLPKELAYESSLSKLRAESFVRSHENKNIAKKNSQQQPQTQISKTAMPQPAKSSSTIAASISSSKGVASKPAVSAKVVDISTSVENDNIKKSKSKEPLSNDMDEATVPTKPTPAAPATEMNIDDNDDNSSSSSRDNKDNNNFNSSSNSSLPKFSRNTPASSASALDARWQTSRATLCATATLVWDTLTPPAPLDDFCMDADNIGRFDGSVGNVTNTDVSSLDPRQIPQQFCDTINLGSVIVEAQALASRINKVAENTARRSDLRHLYRQQVAKFDESDESGDDEYLYYRKLSSSMFIGRKHGELVSEDESMSESSKELKYVLHSPNRNARTETWSERCLPAIQAVMKKGTGNLLFHDVQWESRHARIADILRNLTFSNIMQEFGQQTRKYKNFGPHLILTTEPQIERFASEFWDMEIYWQLLLCKRDPHMRCMVYRGSKKQRRQMRSYWQDANGLATSPFHVLVTSYASFFEDYVHFCQLPWQAVVVDDGASWMAAAQADPNSPLGTLWHKCMWTKNDHQAGLAGTGFKKWNFMNDDLSEDVVKEAYIGLTARYRVISSSLFQILYKQPSEFYSVSGLIDFLMPHYSEIVQIEWDRSRVASDVASMAHFRQLITRSTVVHHCESQETSMQDLAALALDGELPVAEKTDEPVVPLVIEEDAFVAENKISFSRRTCLHWFGAQETSWLRYEFGKASFQPILDFVKICSKNGHFCEEITTASSLSTSGASGQIAGTMAFRCAVRCNRYFGSEQGLRLHVVASHALPGTWLCRTCGTDCVTSQARTHHERNCGQPSIGSGSNVGNNDTGSLGGSVPTVGQNSIGASKKNGNNNSYDINKNPLQQGNFCSDKKDGDGSFRVPQYRGVWVTKNGHHFIKTFDGVKLKNDKKVVYFDSLEDAAKKYDEIAIKERKKNQKVELNYKFDGSRIVYDDVSPASASGLGGNASNAVPALSVINIKDLPPDVKPLLRDPRQISRTGGNSKRHIYAYRGVCRQARKGHDRWQSQISFMGVNHYLGTFDSEWDAAAIYAWAHLILYGEEATRQAQLEGEQAAAAYEQEKKDIASGKIVQQPAADKKKRTLKQPSEPSTEPTLTSSVPASKGGTIQTDSKKRKRLDDVPGHLNKKSKGTSKTGLKAQAEAVGPVLAKGVSRAHILASRILPNKSSLQDIINKCSAKMAFARDLNYQLSSPLDAPSAAESAVRPCIPYKPSESIFGGALLYGLKSTLFEWNLQDFLESRSITSEQDIMTSLQLLESEYDSDGGMNDKFSSLLQLPYCTLGCVSNDTQHMYKLLGLGVVPLGATVGQLDCHVGGPPASCSETAACIAYMPGKKGRNKGADSDIVFHISCESETDTVSVNGRRITLEMGFVPLRHEDICTIGARVFTFLLPG